MNDALTEATESKMVADAERMIDRMIPEEGLSTFGDPMGRSLFGLSGLGAVDLEAGGSAAFAGDLDDDGSAAFGNSDLDSIGTSAFAGDLDASGSNAFAGFGAIGLKSFFGPLALISQKKKAKARSELKKVAAAKQQSDAVVVRETRLASASTAPAQKKLFKQRAKAAEKRSAELTKVGKQLATEAVNPKITRAEAKAAALPVIKSMARRLSATGKSIIGAAAQYPVSKDRVQDVLTQSAAAAISPDSVAPPTDVAMRVRMGGKGADMWEKRPFESQEAWMKRIGRTTPAPAVPATPGSAWSWSKKFAAAMPALQTHAPSNAVSGFLSFGDMETVSHEVEHGDIVQSWEPDDVFGEPDIF